jgi:hypothetical protein
VLRFVDAGYPSLLPPLPPLQRGHRGGVGTQSAALHAGGVLKTVELVAAIVLDTAPRMLRATCSALTSVLTTATLATVGPCRSWFI